MSTRPSSTTKRLFPPGRIAGNHQVRNGNSYRDIDFEDPPIHNIHRNLLSRVFTPRKVAVLELEIREIHHPGAWIR